MYACIYMYIYIDMTCGADLGLSWGYLGVVLEHLSGCLGAVLCFVIDACHHYVSIDAHPLAPHNPTLPHPAQP